MRELNGLHVTSSHHQKRLREVDLVLKRYYVAGPKNQAYLSAARHLNSTRILPAEELELSDDDTEVRNDDKEDSGGDDLGESTSDDDNDPYFEELRRRSDIVSAGGKSVGSSFTVMIIPYIINMILMPIGAQE